MKIANLISIAMAISVLIFSHESYANYSCKPIEDSQCLSDDTKCNLWGSVEIENFIAESSFSAVFYSEDDEDCENCESVDYNYKSGNLFFPAKKKFNLFIANTPKMSLMTSKEEKLKNIILTTENLDGDTYTHLYECQSQ